MKRRAFIAGLGSAVAWPLAVRAQQPRPVIGFVYPGSADASVGNVAAFRKGLGETGYVEGQNVTVEYNWLEEAAESIVELSQRQYDRLPSLMADLVRRRVTVIVASSTPVASAAKAATTTIPIVFSVGGDPVKLGLVASLARPGGNATGINAFSLEVVAKRLALLHELVSKAVRVVAVLVNPANPNAETTLRDVQEAARTNVAVEYRYAENQYDRLPALAADLVRRRVAVIVAVGTDPALAAKAATTTIPIVFVIAGDPVALGLVASLNRPGANLTGIAGLAIELAPKRLQLVHDLIPNAALFGVLADPAFPGNPSMIASLQAAARTLGLQLVVVDARTDSDLEPAFASFSQQRVGAVLIGNNNFYSRYTEQLAALAARHALPAIFPWREYALAGGLMSYGSSLGYGYHQVGIYTGRILKGDKPADLPVQQATKLELIINLKTAKALGLTIPETLLATADEVIQ